jgi:hypothetical protein
MATYYRHCCGHTSLYHPWRTEADVPQADPCQACREARIGETIRFARHGAPPVSQRSRNHRDGTDEEGVSVYEIVGQDIHYTGWYFGIAERPLYLGEGEIVGWGSDGEPLVRMHTIHKATAREKKGLRAA